MKYLVLFSVLLTFICSPLLFASEQTDAMAKAMLKKEERPKPVKKAEQHTTKIVFPPKSALKKPVAAKKTSMPETSHFDPHATPTAAPQAAPSAAPHPSSGKTGGW